MRAAIRYGLSLRYYAMVAALIWLVLHYCTSRCSHHAMSASPALPTVLPSMSPYAQRSILLVIPMPPFQWPLARENLRSWADGQFFPCRIGGASTVDLLLYVSTDGDGTLRSESMVSCFGR